MRGDFWEAYKHPLWQKKRLEIMERDGWKCVLCGDTGTTLNVHHHFYVKGRRPWEYRDHQLSTMCESCHLKQKPLQDRLREALCSMQPKDIEKAIGYLDFLGVPNEREPRRCIGPEWVRGLYDGIYGLIHYKMAARADRAFKDYGMSYWPLLGIIQMSLWAGKLWYFGDALVTPEDGGEE